MSVKFTVVNPRGEIKARPLQPPTARLASLAGKKIGLYSNGKPGMDNLYAVLGGMLKAKFPGLSITTMTGAFLIRDDDAQALAKEVDGFVYGVGD
jgi:hypothetical protein